MTGERLLTVKNYKAMTIRDLEPKLIWEQFDDITRVPRPSKKEAKIIEWLVEFAKKHNIE